jgi:hypothetical protein
VKIPLGFRRKQAANLINWNGTSDHEEFDLLLSSIEEIVGQPPAQKKDIKKLAKGIFGVSTQVTVPRNYEIRGTVMDQSSGTTTHPSWDAGSFAGFFYDIKNNISTETLTINDDFANLQSSRIIPKNALVYSTQGKPLQFKMNEKEGVNASGAANYTVVGWQAEKWIGINDVSNKIAKLAFGDGQGRQENPDNR